MSFIENNGSWLREDTPTSIRLAATKKEQTAPARLPNGRFMSKAQLEAFNRGVTIEEIVKLAEIAANEKRQQQILTPSSSKKRVKHTKDKNGNIRPKCGGEKEAGNIRPKCVSEKETGDPKCANARTSNGFVIKLDNYCNSSPLNQQPGIPNHNFGIKVINGQPVIQARLERVQMADGSIMTVAVLPTDVNISSAANAVVPQRRQPAPQEAQPSHPNSPFVVRLVTPSPPAPKLPGPSGCNLVIGDQPVLTIQPPQAFQAIAPTNGDAAQKSTKPMLPPQLPNERFTFRLSPEDERVVAELSTQIARYQAMPQRTAQDEQVLAMMEEKRKTILQQAASNHLRAVSLSKVNSSVGTVENLSLSTGPQIVQIGGIHYIAIRSGTVRPDNVVNVPHVANVPRLNETSCLKSQDPVLSNSALTADAVPSSSKHAIVDERAVVERRCDRIKHSLRFDQESVLRPDCATPFRNSVDAMRRLIPYHLYEERNVGQDFHAAVDCDFQSYIARCKEKSRGLYRRFFSALDKLSCESASVNSIIANALVLDEERRSFEEERDTAARSPERYMQQLRESQKRNLPIAHPPATNDVEEELVNESSTPVADAAAEGAPAERSSSRPMTLEVQRIDFTLTSSTSQRMEPPGIASSTAVFPSPVSADASHSCRADPTAVLPPAPMPCTNAAAAVTPQSPVTSDAQTADTADGQPRVCVKVVIRNRRISSSDSSSSHCLRGNDSSNSVQRKRTFSGLMEAEYGREEALRVPPLKIRLQCNDTDRDLSTARRSSFSDSPTSQQTVETSALRSLDSSPISERCDEDATTTSPGDSGLEEGNGIGDERAQSVDMDARGGGRPEDGAIPRLKLFRPREFSDGLSPSRRWIKMETDALIDQRIDDDDNEPSDDG